MCNVDVFMAAQLQSQGGTLIFSHIRRFGLFLGVQNSEFQYFLGFSVKMNIFWGVKRFYG